MCVLTAVAVGFAVPASAVAQGPRNEGTALRALDAISRGFGSAFVARIVEVRGESGQSQPPEWWMTVHDPASPTTLGLFWFGEGEATREGADESGYPDRPPRGFFSVSDVRLDSTDAFRKADEAASAAGVGFDSLDYVLRAREFSTEPVWEVTLRNRDGRVVGWTVLSASDGRLLRTIWYRRGRRWEPKVEDSALGVNPPVTTTGVEPGSITPEETPATPVPPSVEAPPPPPPPPLIYSDDAPPPPVDAPAPGGPGNEAGVVVPISPGDC